jgi:hypothetical protein
VEAQQCSFPPSFFMPHSAKRLQAAACLLQLALALLGSWVALAKFKKYAWDIGILQFRFDKFQHWFCHRHQIQSPDA